MTKLLLRLLFSIPFPILVILIGLAFIPILWIPDANVGFAFFLLACVLIGWVTTVPRHTYTDNGYRHEMDAEERAQYVLDRRRYGNSN